VHFLGSGILTSQNRYGQIKGDQRETDGGREEIQLDQKAALKQGTNPGLNRKGSLEKKKKEKN